MKRILSVICVAVLGLSMVIAMSACAKSEFGSGGCDEKEMSVNAVNAGVDDFFVTGQLVVDEGEELSILPSLESGAIRFDFISAEGQDDIDDIPDLEGAEPAFTADVSGTEEQICQFGAGSYNVKATVTEKATGSVQITVRKSSSAADGWTPASSTEEAAELAGIDLFLADPQGTSLGPVTNADYAYQKGVAEGHFGIAAVEMYIRKGLSSINDGDVSFDDNEYAHEWSHDHDGLEVKCFGNREGEATKTIWTKGDYSYAILAYGAGGDDDYGLSAEDLDIILSDIQ